MKIPLREVSRKTGLSPIQVLFELALMGQPVEDCWPHCDDGFAETLRLKVFPETRRFSDPGKESAAPPHEKPATLPVSKFAAAIINKLIVKQYGPRPVQVFTLTKKWVHGSAVEHVEELVQRGYLVWVDSKRECVRLSTDQLEESRRIAEIFRRL